MIFATRGDNLDGALDAAPSTCLTGDRRGREQGASSAETYALTTPVGSAQCRFDPGSNRIGGARIDGKAMAVLVALTEAAPGVVSITALLDRIWPNVEVVDNVVYGAIARLRKALGDDARAPRYIENVARRGYRLIATVGKTERSSVPTPIAVSVPCPSGPLLAVLVFDALADDPETTYLSDGISEEILQTVARSRGLSVIGRAASFHLRGADKAVRRVAAELGATHVLDGSVRRHGSKLRITAQLTECAGQLGVWTRCFERSLGDVFALQDEIAAEVATAVSRVILSGAPIEPIARPLSRQPGDGAGLHIGTLSADLQDSRMAGDDLVQ